MIESDSAYDTRALTIDFIKRAVHQWNYPWSLEPGVEGPLGSLNEMPRQTCSVSVESEPSGARVLVDNIARGKTPTTVRITQGESARLAVKMDNYIPYDEQIDCNTKQVSASLEERRARITIVYAGDYLGCRLGLNVRIGDKTFQPSGNQYPVTDVSPGNQDYIISGQIACQAAGVCSVSGSGTVNIRDGGIYNVSWLNTAYATCSAGLTPQ